VFHRLTVTLLALLVLVAVPGCVYYNTFYHATVAARDAELLRQMRPPGTDPSKAENELLDRVIEKCGRVIKLHPESDWADDALVLMGEALYLQKKYDSAEERFTEFVALYPESEHRPKAEYFLAAVLLAKGNAVTAEEILSEVAFADPPSDLSDDALFLIGDARRKRKRYHEAAEAYQELLDRFPKSERRAEVRYVAAENFIDMGRLEEAASELSAVARERSSRELAFEARLRHADVLVDLGDTEASLAVLDHLVGRTTARDDIDRILLARGRTYEAVGNFEGATEVYDQIAFEHARSDAAAEAHYRIGLIHRDHARNFDDAITSFREAKEQAPRSDVATLATSAIADIEKLRDYLAVIEEHEHGGAPGDSTAAGESTAAAVREPARDDSLGVTALEPARDDSLGVTPLEPPRDTATATGEGRPGADTGDSVVALPPQGDREEPSAAADSLASGLADTTASAEPPPDSWSQWPPPPGPMPAVVDARIEPEEIVDEESEVAIARLRVAELYLLKLESPSEALPYYESVVLKHPESSLAPKAAYAVAWIAEYRTRDLAAAASAYRRVVDRFPETEHADEAEKALARLEAGGEEGDDAGAPDGAGAADDVGTADSDVPDAEEPVTDARGEPSEAPPTSD
jgi:TolA-binding protein